MCDGNQVEADGICTCYQGLIPPQWAEATGTLYDAVLAAFCVQINHRAWARAKFFLSQTPGFAVGRPDGCCAWHMIGDEELLGVVASDCLELVDRN